MRNAFGKPIGRCAPVKAGDIVFQVGVDFKSVAVTKDAMRIARYKLCTPSKIVIIDAKDEDMKKKVPVPNRERYLF
jgi:ribosomal protein L16/L10AE